MTALIIDTETTGFDKPEVIELAWMSVGLGGEANGDLHQRRFMPTKSISLGALATHHILDEELTECPPSFTLSLPAGVQYIVAHNADFDWEAIGKPAIKRIDVLAFCRTLWPDIDSHSLGAMLYHLERSRARELLREAHSASADVLNCQIVLRHCIAKLGPFSDFDAMWQCSERCRVPTKLNFGKHKGALIRDVPLDYKRWLLKQDIDPYLKKALQA